MTVVNVAELVVRQSALRPDAVAIVCGPDRRTWAELDRRATAVAAALAEHGLLAGQRVAILGPNSVAWVAAWFGALRGGHVAVPVNPQSSADEVARIVAHSGSAIMLADPPDDPRVADLPVPVVALTEESEPHAPVLPPRDPDALAVLLYTAGTSGTPKAAMLTHRALLAHCAHADAVGELRADDVIACLLPLSHVFGLNAVLDMATYVGARLVLMDGLPADLSTLLDVIEQEEVTVLPLAPLALRRLLDLPDLQRLSRLRLVMSGAAPLAATTRDAFTERTGVPVDQGYGLTEAGPGVATTVGSERHGIGHVGRVLPGVEVRIGAPHGRRPTERDETDPDRIFVRGDNLFSGYWPDGSGRPDDDGWFDTGDLGYLDGEELFLVDRSRELIIVNGFNVYPAEVEAVISEIPEVQAVAVVGDHGPADEHHDTEQVIAYVVGTTTEAEIADHCARRLPRFKQPAMINIVDDLPRGATGKVKKAALR